jgi:TRAP-type uncharacterized transport system substrate-binding protein
MEIKNMKKVILTLALGFFTAHMSASTLLVADGSSSGTYKVMLEQMNKVLADSGMVLQEVADTHGAVDNLDKLVSNEAQAAFMHSDVIQYRANSEDPDFKEKFQTLITLYPEDVHFLVLSQPYKSGGHTAFGHTIGGTEVQLNSISDLAGLPVGAAGGGYITINAIRLQAEIAYTAVKFNSGAEVLSALDSGQIACAVFVGGAPLPNLKDLGPQYRLIGVSDVTATRLKALYRQTTISYPKMQTEPVHTIAPECVLVARVYKTPKFVASLRAFRNAFNNHLDEIKETPGMHKAWQKVEANNKGKWAYYDLR